MADRPDETTLDAFLGGRLMLRQPRKGHRAGHDAMLLAASAAAKAGDRVVEFGAGVGAAGLALATRVPGIDLVMVEIDPALAHLAESNTAMNGLMAQIVVLDVAADATAFATAGLPPDSVDAVLMNPPFNDPARHRASPDRSRAVAHVAADTTLTDWVHAARRILKSKATLTMIWRADGLADVFAALARGFGSLEVQPIYPSQGSTAIRVIVKAVKGGRAPLQIVSGLIVDCENVRAALQNANALPPACG